MGAYTIIGDYDYNPVHAIWYVLVNSLGMPEEWIDPTSFLAAAEVVHGEGKGVQVRESDHSNAINYIKNILAHIEGVLYYDIDSTLHLKLIREDYTVGNLPIVDESILLSEPAIERSSFMDTYGEIKVQFNERVVDSTGYSFYPPAGGFFNYFPGLIPAPIFAINGKTTSQVINIGTDTITFQAWTPSFYEDGNYIYDHGDPVGYPVRLKVVFDTGVEKYTFYHECSNTTIDMTSAEMCTIGPTKIERELDPNYTGDPYYIQNFYDGDEIEWIFGVQMGLFTNWSIAFEECYARMEVMFQEGNWIPGDRQYITLTFSGSIINEGFIFGTYFDGGGS